MTLPDPHTIPKPRAVTRRGWIVGTTVTVLVAIVYVVVAAFYNVEGGVVFNGQTSDTGQGIEMRLAPMAVDAERGTATVHVSFVSTDETLVDAETQRLTQNTRFLVSSLSGSQEIRFPAGTALGQQDVAIGVDGEQAQYPFDVHRAYLSIVADTYEKNSDGSFTSTGTIPLNVSSGETGSPSGVNGWDTTIDALSLPGSAEIGLEFQRAFSTKVFALVLLVLVVLLSGLALAVGLLVATRRRRVEVALMTYAASLLFALPALRQYLPNAPPIGASIDIYLYLWVIVAAIAAITLIVTSWIVQTRTALLYEREAAKAAVTAQTDDGTGG